MSKTNFHIPAHRGSPQPFGAKKTANGINFAIFSRHAQSVTLVLDLQDHTTGASSHFEFQLDPGENKTGDIWHIFLETSHNDLTYGYRMQGAETSGILGLHYHPETLLIDPYAHELLPRAWGSPAAYGKTPCCRIATHDFDWQNDRPLKTPLTETIIYELHVRGFTRGQHSEVSAPGTYSGIIEKIPYLQQLGITAVELMPITEFDENDTIVRNPDTGKHLQNYWGYNPISFFALKSGYASQPENHINEFKQMVLALHQAGIEVYLDMVYNHTGEGGYQGNTSSFRGIDNPIYYLLDPYTQEYFNFSGCGNTLNCNHPIVRSLIRDSLRYWVTEMHIDGFRFDLASILGRDQAGKVLANPPMIEVISEDPLLRDTKIIAEAWDAAGLYQVGSFSSDSRWAEWNGHFRDDVRAFMAGHEGMVPRLATRLAGSSDLYQASNRTPLSSINFLTSHDGFTLYDLVSYDVKHNASNGEDNRDGDNNNLSWNSGCEGVPCSQAIEQIRQRRMRSMIAILLLSQGVPMVTCGDEFGRSQQGNNNAWCQDNVISWLDWSMLPQNSALHRFFRSCIELRKKHPVFRREKFFPATTTAIADTREISWQYLQPQTENWSPSCHGLGVMLHGKRDGTVRDDDFFLMFNGSRTESLDFTPPPIPGDDGERHWSKIIDTAAHSPNDIQLEGLPLTPSELHLFPVLPLAVCVLQSMPHPAAGLRRKKRKNAMK